MPYCPRCGVEADASVRRCPLCTTEIPRLLDAGEGAPAWPTGRPHHDPSKSYITPAQLHDRAFVVLAAIEATAALAVAAPDVVLSHAITWARWPLIALAACFAFTAAGFVWRGKPARQATSAALITAALLAALDAAGSWQWFLPLALPITVLSFGLLALGAFAIRRSRRLGYNLFALIPALAAFELVGIDAFVSLWTASPALLGWSVVTSLVLGPLAVLFLLLHLMLNHTPDLKRIFHF